MKKRLALITTSVALATSSAANAENQWGLTPYVGADVQSRHMNWSKGLGDNLFAHDAMQGNVYVGVKFNEYFGIEGGYESTSKKDRNVILNAGDIVTGNIINARMTSANVIATSHLHGTHINFVSSFYISETNRLKFLGSLGVISLRAKLTKKLINYMDLGVPVDYSSRPSILYNKRKHVLRIVAGLEHMLTDAWGVRGSITWENTNRLKIPSLNGATPSLAQPKNAIAYGLGAFITF